MALPSYVTTRGVSVGAASSLESGEPLAVEVRITSDRSLVWDATGYRLESDTLIRRGAVGGEVLAVLVTTDSAGWRDAATGALLNVSAPGSFTHRYRAEVTFYDAAGHQVGATRLLGPFPVPAGVGVIDLDLNVPVGTTEGTQLAVPVVLSVNDQTGHVTIPGASPSVVAAAVEDYLEAHPVGGTTTVDGLTDATAVGKAVVKAASAATARGAIGAGTSNLTIGTTAGTAADAAAVATALAGKAAAADGITQAERTKLQGIAAGATVNASDASLRARATHTGTQPLASIDGLVAELADKASLAQLSAAIPGAATETAPGLVERATDAEVTAGTDTTRYVTPKQLKDNAPAPTLANLPAGTTITVLRAGGGVWPARPTARTDVTVVWADLTGLAAANPDGYVAGSDVILDETVI